MKEPRNRVGRFVVALATLAAVTSISGCSQGPPAGAVEADLNVYWDAIVYYHSLKEGDWRETAVVIEYRLECGQTLNSARVLSETSDSVDIAVWIDEGPCEDPSGREVWASTVDIRLKEPLRERAISGFGEPLPEGYYPGPPLRLDFVDATNDGAEELIGPEDTETYGDEPPLRDVKWRDMTESSVGSLLDGILRPVQTEHGEATVIMLSASSLSDVYERSEEIVDLRAYGLEVVYSDRFDSEVWDAGVDPRSGSLVAVPVLDGTYYLALPVAYYVHDPRFSARCTYCEQEAVYLLEWVVDQLASAQE